MAKEKGMSKTIKAAVIVVIVAVAGVGAYFMVRPRAEPEVGIEWFQTGNTLPITQLQPKRSQELEYSRIGTHFSHLWHPERDPEVFPDLVLDASNILELGLKRVRLAINDLDSPKADWSKPEFSIDPSHDDFITSLADNGVTITYVLSFWDKEYVAQGGEVPYPRFKTEDEIQRYLAFVQFIVHHFKDRIEYYEIWNEPTITDTIQWIEVEDYINLVERAVPVIRQEYPEAKIVVGGTDYLIFPESRDYLFSILRSDIMPLVDIVSWHPMYGTSPEYDFHRQYYYEYPSIVQEIKDVASAHGFTGEYVADELVWFTPDQADPTQDWPIAYSETKCAKYFARGIVMHLGMDVTVTQILLWGKPQWFRTIQNLCTAMAGAEPVSLPIEIQSEAENIRSYSFSLSSGDKLIALWTDGVAVDEDPGVEANLTCQGFTAQEVIGIDVLEGFQQPITASNENGNLAIQNLIVRDYPLILHINVYKSSFGYMTGHADPLYMQKSRNTWIPISVVWERAHPGFATWQEIEPRRGQYSWENIDWYVKTAQERGIQILFTVWPFTDWDQETCNLHLEWQPNDWGKDPRDFLPLAHRKGKPCDMEAYKEFLRRLVERYDGDGLEDMSGLRYPIKYWEIGNEPDGAYDPEVGGLFFQGSTEDYFEILKISYITIKEADPAAKVLIAALPSLGFRGKGKLPIWARPDFVPEELFELGAADYFDIMNVHSFGRASELKNFLWSYGAGDKPIWVTEPGGFRTFREDVGAETEEELTLALIRLFEEEFKNKVTRIFLGGPEYLVPALYKAVPLMIRD